jgi:hypothetical protein
VAEIRRAEEVFGRLPAEATRDIGTTMAWGEDRLRFTEVWVHAYSGSQAKLDASTERALELLEHTKQRSATQIKLLQAFGRVHAGDVSAGTKYAGSVYAAQPVEQRTAGITRLAGLVLEAVPARQRAVPAVAAYRESLSASAAIG